MFHYDGKKGLCMKKLMGILLAAVVLVGSSMAVISMNTSAKETTMDGKEQRAISICYKCGGFVVDACLDDMHYKLTSTHNSGQCTYDVYTSRSARICSSCGNLDYISSGEHYCLERHRGCSKGDYYICFCDVRP